MGIKKLYKKTDILLGAREAVTFAMFLVFMSFFVVVLSGIKKDNFSFSDKKFLLEKALKDFKEAYPEELKANGRIKEINLTAKESEIEIFDGYKTRVWAYNGKVPGEAIVVNLGDTVRINFRNELPQSTTIHFHGIRVPNAMDGVPGVTQDPIPPGGKFVYEFTPKDPGTFWFHPHVRGSEQVERGLFAPFVVKDPISKKYNKDLILVIDDWKLDASKQVFPFFNTMMDLMHDGRWGNVITVNAKLKHTIYARPGERLRLRLINTSNARVYRPVLELQGKGGVKHKVIAVDGMYVKKTFELGNFDLAPGNRLDIDIKISRDFKGNIVLKDVFLNQNNSLSTIKVAGTPVDTPEFDYPVNLNIPDWDYLYKVGEGKRYVLSARRGDVSGMMGMRSSDSFPIEWTINGKTFKESEPFDFKYGKVNIFTFENKSPRLHPMHLHGLFFKLIAKDGKPVKENFFRDTILIYPGESVTLATVPLDKGEWANHCHILEHAESGMMTTVRVE